VADPRGKAVLAPLYPKIEAESRERFGGNESAIGMDIMDTMIDMPLVSVLLWLKSAFPMPAEEMVDELLRQVHSLDKEGTTVFNL
jgi:hypothetical protein